MANIYLDVETIPAQPEQEHKSVIAETIKAPATMSVPATIADWHSGAGKYAGVKDQAIEEAYRKTALDGGLGEVISIAWALENNPVAMVNRKIVDSEKSLILSFFAALTADLKINGKGRPPFFIGHNIKFDLKFLFRRCVVLGIHPPFSLPFRGRHDSDYFCNSEAWCGYREQVSQDNLCKALHIEGKPNDIDGSKVWDFVKAGNIARVSEYNIEDVEKVRKIYKRLHFQ